MVSRIRVLDVVGSGVWSASRMAFLIFSRAWVRCPGSC